MPILLTELSLAPWDDHDTADPEGSSVRSFGRLMLLVGVLLFTTVGASRCRAGVRQRDADGHRCRPGATAHTAAADRRPPHRGSYRCTWWTRADRIRGCPVEFPDGRVEVGTLTPDVAAQAVSVRVADTRFVPDTLSAVNTGSNPDAEHRPLPDGLRGALHLSKGRHVG